MPCLDVTSARGYVRTYSLLALIHSRTRLLRRTFHASHIRPCVGAGCTSLHVSDVSVTERRRQYCCSYDAKKFDKVVLYEGLEGRAYVSFGNLPDRFPNNP